MAPPDSKRHCGRANSMPARLIRKRLHFRAHTNRKLLIHLRSDRILSLSAPHLSMTLLNSLNERQREAVLTTEGPLLVLAGAGTGKTRVITYRIAHLLEQGIPGNTILAVTFTNKAAEVMKQRIIELLRSSGRDASDVWVSTFHSFCARMLRREARNLDLPRDFAIYDDDNQKTAIKRAMDQLGFSAEDYPPRSVRAQISHAKNNGITADDMEAEAERSRDSDRKDVAAIFRAYETMLRSANALDFDDLLLRAVELLREHPKVREAWNSRFQYLMVDEFQDTNHAQEEIVRLLAGTQKNVCVVGDEDQSIYGWRGARAGNLKRFTEDFPNARIIRLEENYRSTQTILDAAAAVVENNTGRLGKTLQATLGAGGKLRFFEAHDAPAEAEFICGEIATLVRNDPDARIAVLYRTGAQSRSFEEVLRRLGIRYRVVGGFSFYERAEVRNALAYVRLLFHPEDDVALLRVLNVPPRGIGAVTVSMLEARAKETNQSLWGVIRSGEFLTGKKFSGALNYFRQLMAEATAQGQTLEDVLDRAALIADSDEYDETIPVSLMTLHSAKGLEFDSVFLAGLEEGVLPHSRSVDKTADVEEERRLFYVGMTRAKQSLCFSRAIYRRTYGEERLRASLPSRFLGELPGELIEAVSGSLAELGKLAVTNLIPITPNATLTAPSADALHTGKRRNPRGARKIRLSAHACATRNTVSGRLSKSKAKAKNAN